MKLLVSIATSAGTISMITIDGKVDGRRKRRHSHIKARRDWYAKHRAERFAKHLWCC